MNTKRLLVSFCTIAIALFLVGMVSASAPITSSAPLIEVDGISVADNPAVIAGETVVVEIQFNASVDASDVNIKVEIEGDKADVDAITKSFDVEAGQSYKKALKLEVPYELKDEISDEISLSVKIWNGDYKSEFGDFSLRVQRPSYNADVKSVSVPQSVQAGETFPVEVVLKNMGYNELEDLYVTAKISELGVEKTSYFSDLVPLDNNEYCDSNDDDCDDTVSGQLYLKVPYGVEAGVYTLELTVVNDDAETKVLKQLAVENDVSENVIVSASKKTVKVGETAEYTLLLINPTDSLKVYKVIPESNSGLSSDVESTVVAVPAGSSKTVSVTASADAEGEYDFSVNVFSGDKLVDTAILSLKAEKTSVANPIVVLTVVLAIIFLVLLVVLIVLLGRKPKKTEEFGESYY